MDRLLDFNPEYDFCKECVESGEPCGCNRRGGECNAYHVFNEIFEEWKAYRTAEEQGLLIRLPCKVGADNGTD